MVNYFKKRPYTITLEDIENLTFGAVAKKAGINNHKCIGCKHLFNRIGVSGNSPGGSRWKCTQDNEDILIIFVSQSQGSVDGEKPQDYPNCKSWESKETKIPEKKEESEKNEAKKIDSDSFIEKQSNPFFFWRGR